MNLQELLRKIALYVSNGMPADEADRFVAQESGFQYRSVKELSDALGAKRHAQNVADNPLTGPEKVQRFVGGLAQNALQGLTLNHADEMAGVIGMHTGQLWPGRVNTKPRDAGGNVLPNPMETRYRDAQRQSQRIGDDLLKSGPSVFGAPLGSHIGATAQTVGGLLPMFASGIGTVPGVPAASVVYGPEMAKQAAITGAPGLAAAESKFLPQLGTAVGLGAVFGSVGGSGAAPTMADVPAQALKGGLLGGGLGGLFGLTIPAGAGLVSRGRDVLNIIRNDPMAMRQLADREVGSIMSRETANGNGLPILDRMAEHQLTGVMPADAGPVAASKVRVATNTVPDLRLPAKQIVRTRTEQRANDLAGALERGRGMTQTEARAGEAQAAAAKRAVGDLFDAAEATPLPPESPAAQVLAEIRSWIKPEVIPGPPSATMSPLEAMVTRQNFRMGTGPNPDIVPPAPPPRPFGAARAGRIVDKALRDVGDRPLTVQHVQVAIRRLKDARQATFQGVTRDKSMGPALDAQIDRLQAALDQSSEEIQALNQRYRQQSVAADAFEMGRGTRTAADPDQALADRKAAIQTGAPETRQRLAQGSTADWTDRMRNVNPRRSGPAVSEFLAVANPRNPTTRRTLWNMDFPGTAGRNQVDDAAAMAERMGMTETDMTGNSTSMAQASDIGTDVSFQLVRDAARGGTPKWSMARMAGDLLDNMRIPGRQAMARNVFEDLTRSYTPEVRERLWRLMQIEAERRHTAGLLGSARAHRAGATGGLLGPNSGEQQARIWDILPFVGQ